MCYCFISFSLIKFFFFIYFLSFIFFLLSLLSISFLFFSSFLFLFPNFFKIFFSTNFVSFFLFSPIFSIFHRCFNHFSFDLTSSESLFKTLGPAFNSQLRHRVNQKKFMCVLKGGNSLWSTDAVQYRRIPSYDVRVMSSIPMGGMVL